MQLSADGIRMGYDDEGRGAAVVFIHGFPFRRGIWQKQMEALRPSHRVLLPDLRGFGESESTPGAVTMHQFADDLYALFKKLQTGPVTFVGHSMGGYIALAFAQRYPELLNGLVLVATRPGADTPEAAAARRGTAEKIKAQGTQVIVDAMAPKMLSGSNTDPVMAREVRDFMAPLNPEGVIGALLGMAERSDSTASLPTITVPTLVITGADDTIIAPIESEKMAKAIPGARLNIIPHAGHIVALEQPDEFNRSLSEWLHAQSPLPVHAGTRR